MQCSRCGAPLEPAPGNPLACRYCGEVAAAPRAPPDPPRAEATSARVYVVDGRSYTSLDDVPNDARADFEDAGAVPRQRRSEPPSAPAPYPPSRGGARVATLTIAVALLVAVGVVVSIASRGSGSRRKPPRTHHALGVER